MQFKKKNNNLDKLYIIFFSSLLFINIIFSTSLNADSFKITDLEISESFELNFNKEKVINKGFNKAFLELISMITTSGNKIKIQNTPNSTIKGLIDSFTMSDEKFINNKYVVNFDVNFNKKNVLNFFEKKNIFPSIPKKKKLLLIPVMVDLQKNQISLFNKNIFYKKWNDYDERYFLLKYLLPSEDLEDLSFLVKNINSIEDYDFKDTIKKYDIEHFIILAIYKNNKELRILSKMKLNKSIKIDNQKFDNVDLLKDEDFKFVLNSLKTTYENYWKNINIINTSIKLPLTVSIQSNEHEKIKLFEKSLDQLDLISNYEILKFDNKNIYFKIIYNGPPDKFINDIKKKNITINKQNLIWTIQ
jgi:hypothetical protein